MDYMKLLKLVSALFLILIILFLNDPFMFLKGSLVDLVNRSTDAVHINKVDSIEYSFFTPRSLIIHNLELRAQGVDAKFSKIEANIDIMKLTQKNLHFDSLLINLVAMKNIELDLSGEGISIDLESLSAKGPAEITINKGLGEINLDFEKENKDLKINFTGHLDDLDKVLALFSIKEKKLYGSLKLEGDFAYSEKFSGQLNIYGENLKWVGKDLDRILSAYIDSKQIGLLETAGFFTLGPIGILAAKGVDLGKGAVHGIVDGETKIKALNIGVGLQDNIVKLNDVAFSTEEHRVAAKGRIILDKEPHFQDFSVANINEKGCVLFEQKVSGKLSDPELGVLRTFSGEIFSPIEDIYTRLKELVTSDCRLFYKGRVKG